MKVLKPKPQREHKELKFIGYDVETNPDNRNEFVLATMYGKDVIKTFDSPEEFITEISKKKYRDYKFVATNLPFDFFATFQDTAKRINITERNGQVYQATFYQTISYNENGDLIRQNPVHFYDTLNYLGASVEKLGKIVGHPKMKHPSFFPRLPKNEKQYLELIHYCMNDSVISYLFMEEVIKPWLEREYLSFKMTIAGISMEDFCTNFLDEPLFQESTDIHKRVFNSYYGGRTEVFQRGVSKDVYCYDVNSLYPSVMVEEFPHPNSSKLIEQSSEYIINKYEGVSRVKVFVPRMKIPPLPYRENKGDKLIFPCGTFEGSYCHNELRNAVKYGVKILEYKEGVIYTKTKKFFKKFVESHYAKRQKYKDEGSVLEIMEKGVLNNLYGKFALNYMESTSVQHKDEPVNNENIICITPLGDYISIKIEDCTDAPRYSFPIFSAYVTSKARIKMFQVMHECEDTLLYTDTDSIFLSEPRESSELLGEFKLEDGYPVKTALFIRPKVYQTKDYNKKKKIKLKGMSRVTGSEWLKILRGEEVVKERFTKHRTAIRRNAKGEDLRINEVVEITKTMNLEDDKRVWKSKFNRYRCQQSEAIWLEDIRFPETL